MKPIKNVRAGGGGEGTFDGQASHPGRVAMLLVASSYRNRDYLSCEKGSGDFTLFNHFGFRVEDFIFEYCIEFGSGNFGGNCTRACIALKWR